MATKDTEHGEGPDPAAAGAGEPAGAQIPLRRSRSRSRSTGGVRIEDVARQAGVSPQTVSRFFRAASLVAPATRARIKSAVDETGYVPNLVAGSLASNRSRIVAIVVPTIANPVHSDVVQGLSDKLHGNGYQVLLGISGYEQETESEIITAFLGRRVDGLIITGVATTSAIRALIRASKVPTVEIWEVPEDPIDMAIGFDNTGAGAAVAAHLREVGYRCPLVVGNAAVADTRSAARVAGFQAAWRERDGVEVPVVSVDRTDRREIGERILDAAFARAPGLDSLFAVSDQIAAALVLACSRRGLRVPADLGIAGFGNTELSAQLNPALTTIAIDRYALGRMAGEMLLERFSGGAPPVKQLDLGYKLLVRDSTGPLADRLGKA